MVDVVEERLNVSVDDKFVALKMKLANAGDGAVYTAARAISKAAFQKLFFKTERELPRRGGLQDAITNSGHQQGSLFPAVWLFLNDDFEQREGTILAGAHKVKQLFDAFIGVMRESFYGESVGASAALVFLNAFPGGQELLAGKRSHSGNDTGNWGGKVAVLSAVFKLGR